MTVITASAMRLTETGFVPDAVIRAGIRRLLLKRLAEINASDIAGSATGLNRFVQEMCESQVAPVPELANEQHYEVPAEFFAEVLGKHRKYSACFWQDETETLDQAEASPYSISSKKM